MIGTLGNALITMMLAKFIINDLPHAAGLLADHRDTDPPTPRQLRYIASLCQRLKIATPHEERVKSAGEAGRLIRELEAEVEHRKKSKGENPNPHASYYRIFIPVEGASVTPGSLYWRSAEFRFEEAFIQTTYTETALTPRAASMKYIYSLPERDIPSEVYVENIRNPSDNGKYSGPQLKEEIVQGVAAEGYSFIKSLKSG